MKRKRLITLISLPLIALAILTYLYNEHPLTLKLLNGTARILSPPMKTTIRVDGQVQPTAKCFAMKSRFDGQPTNSLVLWLPSISSTDGREIIMINRDERLVGKPNSSHIQYDLLLNRYLFQAESGSFNVPFGSVKWDDHDPKLEITGNRIQFVLPELASELSGKRVEVVVQ
jgi:hypothetical protein